MQRQFFAIHPSINPDRYLATAFDHGQKHPLRRHAGPGTGIVQSGHRRQNRRVRRPRFDRQHSLSHRRQTFRRRQHRGNPLSPAQPAQPGRSQYDGVVLPLVEFSQSGVQVAPQILDPQVRPQPQQLGFAAQTGGSDRRPGRQFRQTGIATADKGVMRVQTGGYRRENQPRRQFRRHVLEAVHGQIDIPGQHRCFQFLGEQSLAADLRQRHVENLIAGRDDML